jgi:Holliday junction resolvasome RuvABC DNA-binding subunit
VVEPKSLDVQAKVFGALRGLGFREGEVRRVLDEMRARRAFCTARAEVWLREALPRLTSKRA